VRAFEPAAAEVAAGAATDEEAALAVLEAAAAAAEVLVRTAAEAEVRVIEETAAEALAEETEAVLAALAADDTAAELLEELCPLVPSDLSELEPDDEGGGGATDADERPEDALAAWTAELYADPTDAGDVLSFQLDPPTTTVCLPRS
jgi:hypothetical protein